MSVVKKSIATIKAYTLWLLNLRIVRSINRSDFWIDAASFETV
ncbi:hypothetical protein GGQ79_003295 [Ochrobactrum pecoris]|uniref:Uncharacterized protein n=1 Tax=Brucella pecoris TaxID=867683 RepID=A0AB34YVE9_9HYPH|nr:hypothetical protein [Brucella pecoris]